MRLSTELHICVMGEEPERAASAQTESGLRSLLGVGGGRVQDPANVTSVYQVREEGTQIGKFGVVWVVEPR